MKKLHITPPQKGQMVALAKDVYWAQFSLPFRLNHINIYILDCGDGWMVIDSGIYTQDTIEQWQMLLAGAMAEKPVTKILITHHHIDHVGYVQPLAEITGAEIFCSEAEMERLAWFLSLSDEGFADILETSYRRYGLGDEAITAGREQGNRFRRYSAETLPQFTHVQQGQIFTTKEGRWEVRIDKGHAPAHVSLMDRERGLFLCVDFLLPRISPNISADLTDLEADLLLPYLNYLDEIQHVPDEMQIFPGHDWPFCNGGARARDLIQHHQHRLYQLERASGETPLTVARAMDILFGKVFGAHELYFAAGEARAHLNYLVGQNKLSVQQSEAGVDLFIGGSS